MRKTARKALLDEAGKLYVARQELLALKRQRQEIETHIARQEKRVAEAERAVEATLARAAAPGRHATAEERGSPADQLTPGKLPHRVLSTMQRDPARIYSAGEIAAVLAMSDDVQQIRTALARLVGKGLVRRAGVHGEFTL